MKHAVATASLCLALGLSISPAYAQKSCDELKSNIAAKIESKGVKHFQLEIVPADQPTDKRVVGTCEGGKKKIIYTRG